MRDAIEFCTRHVRNNNHTFFFGRVCEAPVSVCDGNPNPGRTTFRVTSINVLKNESRPTFRIGWRAHSHCQEDDATCDPRAGHCFPLIHWNSSHSPVFFGVIGARVEVKSVVNRDRNTFNSRTANKRRLCNGRRFYNRHKRACHSILVWPGHRNRF